MNVDKKTREEIDDEMATRNTQYEGTIQTGPTYVGDAVEAGALHHLWCPYLIPFLVDAAFLLSCCSALSPLVFLATKFTM